MFWKENGKDELVWPNRELGRTAESLVEGKEGRIAAGGSGVLVGRKAMENLDGKTVVSPWKNGGAVESNGFEG